MNLMNKMVVALVGLFCMSGTAFGYQYRVTNKTNKNHTVIIYLNKGPEFLHDDVKPGETKVFKVHSSGCVTKVSVGNQKFSLSSHNICQDTDFDLVDEYYASGNRGTGKVALQWGKRTK